ncbi:hypothetical protein RUM44_011364 [Polyplax serrata]|uniref:Uncharacterized protein n=1 Tax=Polyplax serrata TaxID=468196 RepID=A0ABR1APT9_POLSC
MSRRRHYLNEEHKSTGKKSSKLEAVQKSDCVNQVGSKSKGALNEQSVKRKEDFTGEIPRENPRPFNRVLHQNMLNRMKIERSGEPLTNYPLINNNHGTII